MWCASAQHKSSYGICQQTFPPFVKTENISCALRRFLNRQLADNSQCLLYIRQGPSTRRNHFLQIQKTLIKAATNNQFGEKIFLRSGRAQNIFKFFCEIRPLAQWKHIFTLHLYDKNLLLFFFNPPPLRSSDFIW